MAAITNQVRLDFEKLTENGLKPVLKRFDKYQCHVAKVEATNKGKRESGFLIKNFTLHFDDGQQMLVRVKGDGTVFQVKLNNKVVPIRHVDDMDKAIIEMVDYVQSNARAYERAKIQREKNKRILVPKPSVVTARAEKIKGYKEQLEQVNQINADLEKQRINTEAVIAPKRSDLSKAQSDLETERKITVTLEGEIAGLEEKQKAA